MAFFRILASIIPQKLRKRAESYLSFYTVKAAPTEVVGFITLATILLSIVTGFLLSQIFTIAFWIFFISLIFFTNIIIYLSLVLLVDKRARQIEMSLPDALQLMSSNLRAGMTPDRALLLSSRPEFGPLKDEIDIVGRNVALGKNIDVALLDMAKRIRSKRLARSVELITSGLKSGGSLSTLLQETANDLQSRSLIDKKIKASVTMYVIFIFSATSLIAPILFGLSSYLLEVVKSTFRGIEVPTTTASAFPIQFTEFHISSGFLMFFIVAFLVMNCFMSSQLLGLIARGKQREGYRYFIPMILFSIPLFFLARFLIGKVLGGLFSI